MSLFSTMPSLHAIKVRKMYLETTLAMSFVLKADCLLFCEHDVFTEISYQQFFKLTSKTNSTCLMSAMLKVITQSQCTHLPPIHVRTRL